MLAQSEGWSLGAQQPHRNQAGMTATSGPRVQEAETEGDLGQLAKQVALGSLGNPDSTKVGGEQLRKASTSGLHAYTFTYAHGHARPIPHTYHAQMHTLEKKVFHKQC